jgi:predicted nucleotidyltransferase
MPTDAHPIAPAVRAAIEQQLADIEQRHAVRVLYACESGSRGWGFASPDSDYDVRFIYVHALPWYLQVSAQRDVIEMPISGELDISGWELRKALGLLKKGNATVIEWLDSPVVYRADAGFLQGMRGAARQTHRPERSFHHYIHMARGNYREYLLGESVRLKKYLYVLRPLLAAIWIERGLGVAPMRFQDLVDGLLAGSAVSTAIGELLAVKRATHESETGPPMPALNAFIDAQLERLCATLPSGPVATDFAVLDRLLMATVLQPAPALQPSVAAGGGMANPAPPLPR